MDRNRIKLKYLVKKRSSSNTNKIRIKVRFHKAVIRAEAIASLSRAWYWFILNGDYIRNWHMHRMSCFHNDMEAVIPGTGNIFPGLFWRKKWTGTTLAHFVLRGINQRLVENYASFSTKQLRQCFVFIYQHHAVSHKFTPITLTFFQNIMTTGGK